MKPPAAVELEEIDSSLLRAVGKNVARRPNRQPDPVQRKRSPEIIDWLTVRRHQDCRLTGKLRRLGSCQPSHGRIQQAKAGAKQQHHDQPIPDSQTHWALSNRVFHSLIMNRKPTYSTTLTAKSVTCSLPSTSAMGASVAPS